MQLFCFWQKSILAQNPDKIIDSLLIVLKTAKEDSGKVNNMANLGSQFGMSGDYAKAKQYADSALKLAERLNFKKGKALAYNILGTVDYNKGNYPEALKYQQAALKFFEELGDKTGIANCRNSLGLIYKDQGNYPEALKSHFAAIKVFEELGKKRSIAAANINIGLLYQLQDNYAEALRFFYIALKIYREIGDKYGIANSYINLANIYADQNNYPEALKNYFTALKLNEEIGNKELIALCYYNMGEVYLRQENYDESLKSELASLKIYKELGNQVDVADVYTSIGRISAMKGNYEEALKNFQASLKVYEEAGHRLGITNTNLEIGHIFLALAADKTGEAARIKHNEALKYLNKGLKLANEMGVKLYVMNAYGLLSELYEGMNDYKKALEFHNLYVGLKDSLTNNETTSKLEQQRIQYEVEKSVEEEKIKSEVALAEQKAGLKRKNELLLAGFAILAIITFFIALLIRQHNQKRRAIEKAEAGHKMAELELQSLRAQLNPHFMFNSLNAIQDLILKEDNDRSHLYLSRFSKLLRMLLDNADQPFVTVKQELELLELYLSLENLRIPNLQYSIEKDPKLNREDRMIPNMMLQPYIENAIWHGLSNKKGERKLQIRIHENGAATEFEIEDNGIGRKKAAELKQQFRHGHHSKGMQLLSKRFELLSHEYGAEIQTTITDLQNNNDATGTLVKINVPFTLSQHANQLTHDTNHNN